MEIELEHALGVAGDALHTLITHPLDQVRFFYPIGSYIVIGNLADSYFSYPPFSHILAIVQY